MQAAKRLMKETLFLDGFHEGMTVAVMQQLTAGTNVGNKISVESVPRQYMGFGWGATFGHTQNPHLAAAAGQQIGMPFVTCAGLCNWSRLGQVYTKLYNRLSLELEEKIVFIL
jgi:hypothetical protein